MVNLSVCIEPIFKDLPFVDRIPKVAEAGVPAFEFWRWDNKEDLDAIKAAADRCGLKVAAHGMGSKNDLVSPSARDAYLEDLEKSIGVAKKLGCCTVINTTGNELQDVSRAEQHKAIVGHLKAAAPIAEDAGIVIVLEPLNTLVDHKGYYLDRTDEAVQIVTAVNSPNVKLLYDVYHMQIMEGNIIETIESIIGHVGHFHIADVPGRHQPGTGELNYANIFKKIEELGYKGYVGMEYKPLGGDLETVKSVVALAQ